MRRTSFGLRARLLVLVLAAVIPAFGVIGYTAISQRQQAALTAERDAMNFVRLAAREQSRLIGDTRQTLVRLSGLPVLSNLQNIAACNSALAEAHAAYPYYTNIGIATLDGNLICNSRPITRTINIADRSYFRRTLQSRHFSIGDYQIGRITGEPAINFGYPLLDSEGNFKAVIYAALNLGWLHQLIAGIELPPGSTLLVVDSRGTVLTRHPHGDKWIGKSAKEAPLVKLLLSENEGAVNVTGLDGVLRLYAFAPLLADEVATNVYVAVGIPHDVAFAAANADVRRNLLLLLAVWMITIIAAWVGGDVFVLRHINALTDAARRFAKGDLSARAGVAHGTGELRQLGEAFDKMATTLQAVNRALKTLTAANRAMVRATEEEALLAEICRIVVEVGGYRFAWIGFAEHDENKSVRPVAQVGFEGGLETLAVVAGKISWEENEHGRGPVGTAIRTASPHVVRNLLTDPSFAPWRDEAHKRGYASSAALPLYVKGTVIGALSIYSAEPDAFDAEELQLLDEAAEDLAFGISVLRTRGEHDRAHATIAHMAFHDSLTGLPNHAQFEERLRKGLAEAGPQDRVLALLMIDINRLREINDALGFHQGDMLLKDIGARISRVLKQDAFMARMRGDDFAVLLPVDDAEEAAKAALAIMTALRTPFQIGELNLDIGATAGISLFPQHAVEPTRLIRYADVAMQQAKSSGKGYAFYAVEQDGDRTRRLQLAAELRRAIEEGQLTLYYQAKVEMRTGRICGVEALARWPHPTRGMIPPDEFIPLAEHTGLIKALTDWVVGAAMRQSLMWRQSGIDLPIAVNLSARNLHDQEFVFHVDESLAAGRADPGWLELEITEGAVMQDPEGALQTLKRLSAMGITLFIDDFGTGYSSLSYLRKLPVDAIKIDKSFVIDMLIDADAATIVRSTIGLAHDLGLKVVAEGVENQAMWDQLATLGCDVAQGYFISKPLPAEQFKNWFDQHGLGSLAMRIA